MGKTRKRKSKKTIQIDVWLEAEIVDYLRAVADLAGVGVNQVAVTLLCATHVREKMAAEAKRKKVLR